MANSYSPIIAMHPYGFQFSHTGLSYLLMPLVVISSIALMLYPGIFLVLAIGKTSQWTNTLIQAFGASFIAYVFLISMVKLILPVPPNPSAFQTAVALTGLLTWIFLAYRVFRGTKLPWPLSKKEDIRRLFWTLVIPLIVLLSMLPVFFWQDMHDDGFEVLEIGRSLSEYLLPRFPNLTGVVALGQGMLPMAYPVHWFVSQFGPLEVSARLPILLYLPVLFCLLVQLIEWRSPRNLRSIEEAMLCLALGIYAVTMIYNASYDPYFADIAAPAASETLTVTFLMGMIYFLFRGHLFWFLFFAIISFLCRPTGLLILGFLGIAVFISSLGNRKTHVMWILTAIFLCGILAFAYNKFYIASIVGEGGSGFPLRGLLGRFRYLRLDDLSRINYVLFPSGILPFLFLLAFYWQDPLARAIAFVSLSYFIFFFSLAFVALHHFVPVMILPLVVFWRLYLGYPKLPRRLSIPVIALAGVLSLWLSLPRHFEINRTIRAIGQRTAFLIGDYNSDYQTLAQRAKLLFKLIPPDWKVQDPTKELVSGYCSLIYYSTRPKAPDIRINYILQPLYYQGAPKFIKIADDNVAALYVKDLQQWHNDRMRSFRTDYRSPLYDIPRTTLFRHWGAPKGAYTIDLKKMMASLDIL
jgi:hypothetical protein